MQHHRSCESPMKVATAAGPTGRAWLGFRDESGPGPRLIACMFIIVLCSVLGLAHLYVWKRLIKDTTAPGRTRWALSAVFLLLAALLVMTLTVPRFTGIDESAWFAWPGYIWFALVGYLLLALLVLEPVRLVLRGWVKRARNPEPVMAGEPAAAADERRTAAGVNRRV